MNPSISRSNDAFVRVVLADDHEQTRTSLRRLLERSGPIIVVGEATSGREALRLLAQTPADVLLLDVDMSPMNGIDVMKRLSQTTLPIRVLGLSNYSDPAYVFEMLAYGAAGYLSKEDATDVIVDAVCRVAAGTRCQLSPTLWKTLRQRTSRLQEWPLEHDAPTNTHEVIRLIAAGYPDECIAERLDISVRTIEVIAHQVCKALAFQVRAELVAWGWRQGLVTPPTPS